MKKKLLNISFSSFLFPLLIFPFSSLTLASDQDQAIVHYNQGYDYYKKGEYDKAIDELTNSLKFDADNENAFYGLGNCYYRKQIYEKAVETYSKAIEINPDFANAHYGLGTAFSALRKTDEADKEFTVYRKLKSAQSQAEGTVSTVKESTKLHTSSDKKEKSVASKKIKPSIKSGKEEGRTLDKGNKSVSSTKDKIKDILSIPKIRLPKAYVKSFADTWNNSYIGKIIIGVIGYIGVAQIWLAIVAFQGLILWEIKKRTKGY